MKILQILPALNQGGVEHCVLENAEYLVKAGHESIVVSSGGRLTSKLERAGSKHIMMPIAKKSLWTFWQVKKLRKLIDLLQPDIVHVHSRMQAWLCHFALKQVKNREKVHYITNVHGFNSVNFYSKIMLMGDRVILESASIRNYIDQNYPTVKKNHLQVIPLGVDTDRFNISVNNNQIIENFKKIDPMLNDSKIVAIVGRITRIKGHHHFIELIKKLKKSIPNVKGLIVGNSDEGAQHYYEELVDKIAQVGLQREILFYGHCDDMPALYKSVDLTVSLTTKPESYGRTILESLACQTPVVGFNQGGVGDNLIKYYPQGNANINDFEDVYQRAKSALLQKQVIPEINETLAVAQQQLQALYQSLVNNRN